MSVRRILYRSKAADNLSSADAFAMVAACERRNAATNITGFLLDFDSTFLQLIEGPPLAIAALMERIVADPRHRDVEVLVDEAGDQRWFPEWAMKHMISFSGRPAGEELRQILRTHRDSGEVLAHVETFITG